MEENTAETPIVEPIQDPDPTLQSVDPSAVAPVKRGRGRPKGSTNKKKSVQQQSPQENSAPSRSQGLFSGDPPGHEHVDSPSFLKENAVASPSRKAGRSTLREELNKIKIPGFYVSDYGTIEVGDVLYRIAELIARTGYYPDPNDPSQIRKNQNLPVGKMLIEWLTQPVPVGIKVEERGSTVGPDPRSAPGPSTEIEIIELGSGAMVMVPHSLSNVRRPVLDLTQNRFEE